MTTLKSRWLEWQPSPPLSPPAADTPPPEPNVREKGTDKTDKSPSVSFVSAVSGHIAADDNQVAGAWDTTDWQAHFHERAGIREFDGELSRPEAERRALADTINHWLVMHPPKPTDDNDGCVHCRTAPRP